MELAIKLNPTASCAEIISMMRPPRYSTFENLILSYKTQIRSYRAALTNRTCRTLDIDEAQQIVVSFVTTYDLLRVPTCQQ